MITDDAITHEKMEESAALSVLGVTGNAAAHVADITAASDHKVLRRNGTSLGFGAVHTDGIANDAVTSAKLNSTDSAEAVTSDVIRDDAVGDDALDLDAISVYRDSSGKDGYRIFIQSGTPSYGAAGTLWFQI